MGQLLMTRNVQYTLRQSIATTVYQHLQCSSILLKPNVFHNIEIRDSEKSIVSIINANIYVLYIYIYTIFFYLYLSIWHPVAQLKEWTSGPIPQILITYIITENVSKNINIFILYQNSDRFGLRLHFYYKIFFMYFFIKEKKRI